MAQWIEIKRGAHTLPTEDVLYAISENATSSELSLIYSDDDGDTWSEITGNMDAPYCGSLTYQNEYIYWACGDRGNGFWIGRHEHGTSNTYKIDVLTLLGYGASNSIGPIGVLDEDNIYFVIYRSGSEYNRLMHFNGNWASPVSGDFTILDTISNSDPCHPRSIVVNDSDDIYIGTKRAYSHSSRGLLHWNGSSLSYDTSLLGHPDRFTVAGITTYNGDVWVYGWEWDQGAGTKTYKIFSGSVGSWTEEHSFTKTNANEPSDQFMRDGSLYIDPDTGYIYIGLVYNTNNYLYMGIYNGSSWSYELVDSDPGQANDNPSIRSVDSDKIMLGYYNDGELKIWNGSSFTTKSISGYNNIYGILPCTMTVS